MLGENVGNEPRTLGLLRRLLIGILAIGMLGATTELLLLKHDESMTQIIPIGLLACGLIVSAWHAASGSRSSVQALQLIMALFIVSGAVGVVLHYRANLEFQLEIDPSASATALFWKVVRAKAPPALAPGAMVQLGLIGLAATFRHPATRLMPPA